MDKDLRLLKCQIQEFVDKYQIEDFTVYIDKITNFALDEEVAIKRNVSVSVEV